MRNGAQASGLWGPGRRSALAAAGACRSARAGRGSRVPGAKLGAAGTPQGALARGALRPGGRARWALGLRLCKAELPSLCRPLSLLLPPPSLHPSLPGCCRRAPHLPLYSRVHWEPRSRPHCSPARYPPPSARLPTQHLEWSPGFRRDQTLCSAAFPPALAKVASEDAGGVQVWRVTRSLHPLTPRPTCAPPPTPHPKSTPKADLHLGGGTPCPGLNSLSALGPWHTQVSPCKSVFPGSVLGRCAAQATFWSAFAPGCRACLFLQLLF